MKGYWIQAAGIGIGALVLSFILVKGGAIPAGLSMIFLGLLASCTSAAIREFDRRLRTLEKAAGEETVARTTEPAIGL